VRHLEAAAIGLVFAIAAAYMAVLSARQASSVHHLGAQRALAWALLNAQKPENVTQLLALALNGTQTEVLLSNPGEPLKPRLPVCYSAALVNATSNEVKVVTVCAGP